MAGISATHNARLAVSLKGEALVVAHIKQCIFGEGHHCISGIKNTNTPVCDHLFYCYIFSMDV